MIKTHKFKMGTYFLVDHLAQKCLTIFADDTMCPAIPEPTDYDFAEECGYGRDVWKLNWHHEFIHSWLAEQRKQPVSNVLWNVAHGNSEVTQQTEQEEADVINVQKEYNGGSELPELRQLLSYLDYQI